MQSIFGSFILLLLLLLQSNAFGSDLKIWYRQPAENWFQALPVGNGRLGGMVFGGTKEELIQLNEDSVWSGQPYYKATPDMLENIPKVRQLLFEGKYTEANALCKDTMTIENDPRYGSYRPLGDLRISLDSITGQIENYQRNLDLDTAIATTTFSDGNAVYAREVFATAIDQVFVVRLTANRPRTISCTIGLSREHRAKTDTAGRDTLVMNGYCENGGVKFQVRLKVINDSGTVKTIDDKIQIKASNALTILIAANTTYRHGDYETACKRQIEKASKKSYVDLRADHIADHRELFRRVALDLGRTKAANLPTDERLRLLKEGTEEMADDLQLVVLHFQFGRYLLIASSRPGSLAANLQGIWNPLFDPPWFCDYTVNVNTEMNYWLAETCNLAELAQPLFDFIDECRKTGSIAARERYGCRGWVLSSRTTPWASSELRSSLVGLWQEGAAWLCQHLWEHYRFSGDRKFLADRAYPPLKEVAEFYLDFLVEHPKYKWFVSGPTVSPENGFVVPESKGSSLSASMGSTMANQLIDDVFSECIQASRTLGIDERFRAELIEKRKHLAPMQIGKYGQLQEWIEDFEEANPGHRHLSHLYGLQPGSKITLRGTPKLAAAAQKSLERRLEHGSGWTGWSAAWIMNLWARLEDGDKAYESLKSQMRKCLFPNMLGNHRRATGTVFQIDANFGASNGIAEMLLQSHTDEIHLLPALPQAWAQGSVKGLLARGGFELNIQWREGRLTEAAIHSNIGAKCKVRYNETVIEFDTDPGERYTLKAGQFEQKATSAKVEVIEEHTPVVVDSILSGSTLSNKAYEIEVARDASVKVTSKQNDIWACFTPKFTVWYNSENPKLGYSYNYNVIEKWKADTSSLNYQVPAWNGDYDFFHAPGSKFVVYANSVKVTGSTLTWEFPEKDNFKLTADLRLPGESAEPELTFHLRTKASGYYTVGYLGAPEKNPKATDWIWQPLIWQGKRFPLVSYLTQEYRFPIPAILMGIDGATVGLAVDPKESPFRLPERHNSRFGGLIRNSEANAQPMVFAPVYGGPGSMMAAGENFDFTIRLIVKHGDWYETYKDLAYNTYSFHDYRKNGICTLNETLDNIVDFVLTDKYSYWYPEMKTNGYQTDKKGWGRQQSAVSPLSLAMVRDSQELYDRRALPSIEYMTSRKVNLVKLDGSMPFMSGPGSTVMDWAALYLMSGKRMELFAEFAKQKAGDILNAAQSSEEGQVSKEQALSQAKDLLRPLVAMYRLSDEPEYLSLARKLADNYIYWRIDRQPIDFYDAGSSFWNEIAPMYDILYELFEITGDNKYLDAAVRSMNQFTGFVYLQPTVPNKNIVVNKGGSFRGVPGPEESVPAWRVSANGLMSECAGTSHSHRGIFMAPYAPYMIKFAHYSNEKFYRDIARSAMIGRYANYPSYAYRHGHTTIYEKPDYPLRSFEELTWTSEHYNHPTPMCTYIVDYLLGEAFYRSAGRIYFPSRYTATGAYFRNQVYGDRPGKFYDDIGLWLWLPKGLVKADHLQVNYIAAHGNGKLYLALMNQSNEPITTTLSLNPKLVIFNKKSEAKIWKENIFLGRTKVEGSKITVDVGAKGIVALAIDNTLIKTAFQYKYINDRPSKLSERSFKVVQTPVGKITGMIISFARPLTSSYIWLEANTEQLKKAVLHYSTGVKWEKVTDDKYPFEFTVKLDGRTEDFNFYIEGLETNGSIEKSETVNLKLYDD